jgi:hypothetical protein
MPAINNIKLHAPKIRGTAMKDNFGQGSPYAIVPMRFPHYVNAIIATVKHHAYRTRYNYRGLVDELEFARDRAMYEITSQYPEDWWGATARFKHAILNCVKNYVPRPHATADPSKMEQNCKDLLREVARMHDTTKVIL